MKTTMTNQVTKGMFCNNSKIATLMSLKNTLKKKKEIRLDSVSITESITESIIEPIIYKC